MEFIEGVNLQGLVHEILQEVADGLLATFASKELRPDAWDFNGLRDVMSHQFAVVLDHDLDPADRDGLLEQLTTAFSRAYDAKREAIGPTLMPQLERHVLLSIMDAKWKDHLYMMDALREGIHLRAYGQRDPIVEYQREAYAMFQDMIASIKVESLTLLLRIQPREPSAEGQQAPPQPRPVFDLTKQRLIHEEAPKLNEAAVGSRLEAEGESVESFPGTLPRASSLQPPAQSTTVQRGGPKVGRNDPCHCGSGLKYKKCHGK
jgi:preprotein translocase subunit SecA